MMTSSSRSHLLVSLTFKFVWRSRNTTGAEWIKISNRGQKCLNVLICQANCVWHRLKAMVIGRPFAIKRQLISFHPILVENCFPICVNVLSQKSGRSVSFVTREFTHDERAKINRKQEIAMCVGEERKSDTCVTRRAFDPMNSIVPHRWVNIDFLLLWLVPPNKALIDTRINFFSTPRDSIFSCAHMCRIRQSCYSRAIKLWRHARAEHFSFRRST